MDWNGFIHKVEEKLRLVEVRKVEEYKGLSGAWRLWCGNAARAAGTTVMQVITQLKQLKADSARAVCCCGLPPDVGAWL